MNCLLLHDLTTLYYAEQKIPTRKVDTFAMRDYAEVKPVILSSARQNIARLGTPDALGFKFAPLLCASYAWLCGTP